MRRGSLGVTLRGRAICTLNSLVTILAGCATASKDIAPTYVSPTQYANYDCSQLNAEATRIQARVTQLGGRLDEAAGNDKTITGFGAVLFWPALFFLGGTKQQEAEFARLKGEYDAVQQAAIQKRCSGGAPGATGTPSTKPFGASTAPAATQIRR